MRPTGKIVGQAMPVDRHIDGRPHAVKRHRFDQVRYRTHPDDPWNVVNLRNHGATGFEMERDPFGIGSERLAYRFFEISHNNNEDKDNNGGGGHTYQKRGKMMVAKTSLYNETMRMKEFHIDFCRVQNKSSELSEAFNDAVRRAPRLRPVDATTKCPSIKFLLCHVYTFTDETSRKESGVLVEQFLKGKFTKYNGNNGFVRKIPPVVNDDGSGGGGGGGRNGTVKTMNLVAGTVALEEFVQAFSHWVYVHTDHKMLVCDLQGVLNMEGRYPEFELTDPAICTLKQRRYGKTDMRIQGIRNFCRTHKCGLVCESLGLPCMKSSHSNANNPSPQNRSAGKI